ncbi:FimB/Mfa2 family fimbrial subunit [uncultured Bacteroides sp.]|uniref:FimB/Mfa2 family fimbrial subunit n=2 Tax=uncultured Bacteroides sp. TaxID=162156 RepID=UPI0025DE1D4B|nr:FimB/Mfa2 family fimbrial subunit [uncultured Bacteroides sp.]
MRMLELRRIWHTCMIVGMIVLGVSSCDSAIYDDEGDCTVHYRVSFRYTKNMLRADAFAPQVTRVHLYVFDKQGRLVTQQTTDRQPTTDNNFFMDINVPSGTYDLLAWCEGASPIADATSFVIGGGTSPAAISDLKATLPLQGTAPSQYSDRDITRLYHGLATNVDFPDTYGTVDIAPIYLTRDTKHLSVLLQNVDGSAIERDKFTFAIEASNQVIDHRNNIISSTPFSYLPWSTELTSASFDQNDTAPEVRAGETTRVQTEANGLLAELTTGRLVAGRHPRLVVRNSEGEDVIRIDLIRYLLLVKSKYEGTNSDQDYLDCYDDHTMMFFIENGTWAKAKIYINNWRVVPPQDTEL